MGQETIKLELIEWLMTLDDETLDFIKVVKDSNSSHNDWWIDLSDEQREGINRGLEDIKEGRIVPHKTIKQKYDL